jgi:hypothetical protein
MSAAEAPRPLHDEPVEARRCERCNGFHDAGDCLRSESQCKHGVRWTAPCALCGRTASDEPRLCMMGCGRPVTVRVGLTELCAIGSCPGPKNSDEPHGQHTDGIRTYEPRKLGFMPATLEREILSDEPRCTNATCTICDEHDRCTAAPREPLRTHWRAMPFASKQDSDVIAAVLAEVARLEAAQQGDIPHTDLALEMVDDLLLDFVTPPDPDACTR